MMSSKINKVLSIISKKMNEENDSHSKLLADIHMVYPADYEDNFFQTIKLIHDTKIKLLEDLRNEIKKEVK